ncbi:hypothetical protein BOX15_Mlig023345g1 [Macrostomum lignano]|uniref:Protein kinase domain-containing protein n=3 Tax=Macrostomum lignano TaxID=282301 RepID=A0A267EKG8_9PLAT|nr:hypothetical protein BOX15_Mlig023345g1 [Macrostomum lignano]
MGNDVSVSASEFAFNDMQTHKFGSYSIEYSTFHVTEANHKFVKSSHINSSLTCFIYKSNEEAIANECFSNALVLKSVRHPSIVKFLDSIRQSWLTGIVTELVSPLEDYLPDLYPDEAVQGVHSICSALAFLHATAQLSHNNVCQRSLFCTSQGQWKLGGFELCRPFGQMSADVLKTVRTRLGDCAIDRDEAYVFSADRRDSFDLYCLGRTALDICDAIDAVRCSKLPDPQPQQQRRRQHLDQLRNLAKNCLCSASPTERTPAKRLQRHVAFSANCFTQLSGFLADFSLKSEDELRQFYVALKSRLFELPEGLVARRLGRLLLGRLPLTHPMAATYLLPYLLRPYRGAARPPDGDCLLSEANFQRELVPYLAMVLRIRDLPVRCALLEHFPAYCHLLDWAGAHRSLIPELLLGLRDRHDRLVARTHLAVAALLPLAGYAALFGDKADAARQSLFTDAQPRRRLLGAAPGDPADQLGTAAGVGDSGFNSSSSCGAGSAPLPLRDLAALSDRYRGPEEAAAAEARRQAAMVEAESARILADRHRLKSAAQDDNSRLATVAEGPPPVATLSDPDDDDADWGNEWESDGMAGGGGSDAGNAGDVEIAASDSQPAPAPSKQPPPSSSQTAGLTAEALTIKPVVTAAGRQIDEFLAELEPSIRGASSSASVSMATKEQQQQQTTPSAALALAMAEGEVGEADAADGWSDDGDAWGLDEEVDDDEDASAAAPGRCNGGAGEDQQPAATERPASAGDA